MPRLYDALVNNENISELSLPVFGRGKNGRETFLYEIKLRNANIAGIQLESSDDPAKPDTLWVSFTYQKIDWTWADGGVTAQDDWEAPVAAGAPKKPK